MAEPWELELLGYVEKSGRSAEYLATVYLSGVLLERGPGHYENLFPGDLTSKDKNNLAMQNLSFEMERFGRLALAFLLKSGSLPNALGEKLSTFFLRDKDTENLREFVMSGRSRRKRNSNDIRDTALAGQVAAKHYFGGSTVTDAKVAVQEETGFSFDLVERAWEKWRHLYMHLAA